MKKIIAMLAGAAMMVSCGGNQTQEESSTIKVGGNGTFNWFCCYVWNYY